VELSIPSITNPVDDSFLKELKAIFHTLPHWRRISSENSIKEVAMGEVLRLENPSTKASWFLDQSPSKSGKHSLVKEFHVSKTKTTFALWSGDVFPSSPMGFQPHQKSLINFS
jgi:hypothetical protein